MSRKIPTPYVGWALVLLLLLGIGWAGSIAWSILFYDNRPSATSESVIKQLPAGFVVHDESKRRTFDVSGDRSGTDYVVDVPTQPDQAIKTFIDTYVRKGWQQRSTSSNMVSKDEVGCIAVETTESFVALHQDGFVSEAEYDKESVDWANRAVTNPERQLIVSLLPC